jgi:hypothetical protein
VAGIGTDAGVHGHSDTGFGLFGETGEAAGANLPKGLDELTFGAGGRGDAGGLLGIGGEVGVMDCNAYGTGVLAAGSSYGAMLQGGLAPLHLTPANISGRPQSGSYMKGDIFVDSSARLFVCVADGKPGTWVEVLTRPAQK